LSEQKMSSLRKTDSIVIAERREQKGKNIRG